MPAARHHRAVPLLDAGTCQNNSSPDDSQRRLNNFARQVSTPLKDIAAAAAASGLPV